MTLRGALRRWRGVLGGLVGGGLVAYAVGMDAGAAVVVGFGVAAIVVMARRLGADLEPEWGTEHRRRQEGARGDLQDLAWSMAGRDGRAGERAMRRLRDVAAVRLARHGLDLASRDDTPALRALLGDRVLDTLRRRQAPLPSLRAVQQAVDALERLGPRPTSGTLVANPAAVVSTAPADGATAPDPTAAPDPTTARGPTATPDQQHPHPGRNR